MPFVDKIRIAMGLHVEPGCEKVTFETGTGNVSRPFRLLARTWLEDCQPIGSPYGGCIPQRRLARTDEIMATVEVAGRQATDPQERFLVCYYGVRGLSGTVKSSPFKYHRAKEEAGGRLVFRRKS